MIIHFVLIAVGLIVLGAAHRNPLGYVAIGLGVLLLLLQLFSLA